MDYIFVTGPPKLIHNAKSEELKALCERLKLAIDCTGRKGRPVKADYVHAILLKVSQLINLCASSMTLKNMISAR